MINHLTLFLFFIGSFLLASASDLIPPDVIKKNAHAIDVVVAKNFKANKISVPEFTNDATFLRRAFLVSLGRIPSPQEALQFLELEHPEKRALLIDYLYQSEGYKSHTTNWLMDLLTLRERYRGPIGSPMSNARLIDWVRDAVEVNMAWDDFCVNLLSTKGNAWATSGAAGYHAKGDAIDDHLSNTLRIFTGVRMECAQCHDDPFQEWEQMDFYQLKAFVEGGMHFNGVANGPDKFERGVRVLQAENPEKFSNNSVGGISGLNKAIASFAYYGVNEDKGKGRVALPKDYKYKDGDPGEMVRGRTAYGAKLKTKDDKDDAEALDKFAAWMVSDDTPQFAETIACRLWERIMGVSLTPVTGDYVAPEDTEFRDLIRLMSGIIKNYEYDIKTFQKTLMLTKTFQFVSSHKDLKNGEKNALDGRRVNRMSAEQIWDSLMALIFSDPEALPKRQRASLDFAYAGQSIMSIPELVKKVNTMSEQEYEKFLLTTYEKLKKNQFPSAETVSAESEDEMMSSPRKKKFKVRQALIRVSEFPSPAPSDHFLRIFGQSSRQAAIDEASKEGTISQALSLLNGTIQKHVVFNDDAIVNQVVNEMEGVEARIRTIYLVVLNRIPAPEEMALCKELLEESSSEEEFYRNIVGGLITSQEFYFIF